MVERWEQVNTDRGTCKGCGNSYQLTKRGLVRRHPIVDRYCPGGGKPPEEG